MTKSGLGVRFVGLYPFRTGMDKSLKRLLMGGYIFSSEPLTRYPSCFKIPARGAIPAPQIPMR
jgi:hypothetical protein